MWRVIEWCPVGRGRCRERGVTIWDLLGWVGKVCCVWLACVTRRIDGLSVWACCSSLVGVACVDWVSDIAGGADGWSEVCGWTGCVGRGGRVRRVKRGEGGIVWKSALGCPWPWTWHQTGVEESWA